MKLNLFVNSLKAQLVLYKQKQDTPGGNGCKEVWSKETNGIEEISLFLIMLAKILVPENHKST